MPAARMVHTVVHRADSVRSEQSDASQANKRVSFNRDVDVKHKGKKSSSAGLNSRQGLVDINGEELGSRIPAPVYAVYKEPTSLTEAELALEAERIIKQVDQISCTVSPNPAVFGTAGGGVPGGPVSVYETRSLERRPKRNNNSTPQQQQQQHHQYQHQQQQHHPGETNWTRTLPGGSSTKNQLLDRNSVSVKTSNKDVVEKNSNIIQQQQRQQRQLVVEQQQVTQKRETTTTPPKYDSGIEMEGGGGHRGDIPGKRPNVNLIVQQLTEEARQRELMRQQYQQQQEEEEEIAARNKDDPLAPRLPVLNLIEPDPQFGLAHNRNLPFSYTGGVSPTRLSPLRSSGMRFPSPPKTEPQDEEDASGVDPGLKDDIVYAQVKVARKQSKSPDPFHYPSATAASGGVKLHLQPTARRPSNDYYADDDDQRDDEDDQDIEARKAKARFLFGTRIEEDVARRKQEKEQQERFRPSVRLDQRNNNRNNSHPTGTGLSYNYSSLIKGKQEPQQQNSYTTKVSVNSESSERKQHRVIHQYKDDDDFARRRLSPGGYKDRSMSPEPRIIQPTQQSVATRIRSLEMRSSPERYRDEIIQTLPQIKKAHHHQQQQQMTSTRLIQEAERGRTSSRRFKAPAPSRPIQVQSRHESIGPPKPPVRVKKLSRERMDAATSTSPKGKKKFQKIVPWQPDAGSESSPERTTAFNNSSPPRRFTSYRYPSHQRSVSPSPERIHYYNNNNNINNNNVNNQQQTMTLGRPINKKTTTATVESIQDGKQEKMHRQRSKFLSVFLGPKTSKSSNKTVNAAVQTTATSAVSSRKQPAISKWEDDVDLSAIKKTPKVQQTRLTFQHQQPPSNPSSSKYRRGSTDRTDTSESDDVHHHRFKSLKQKSQSFNNLNYRPDPERVLGEEEPRQRHDWNANNQTTVDNRRPVDMNKANNNVTTVVTGGRYYHNDARPYASTNLINQIGRSTVEIGEDRNNDIIIDEGGINRPNPLDHNNPRTSSSSRPMMAMPARQMRYFGDTDLESQQSVTNGHISHRPSVRYIPKVNKVAQRSVSNAAGMGAVRRSVMQRNNTGSGGSGGKTQLHSVNSSESEGNGSAMQSGASAESQRSVYLHATTVADIPTITPVPNSAKAQQMQSARRRALSREDMSALSGSDRAGSTLRRTRQISRSYSVLAPWKPRHYRDKFEITYSNQQAPAGPAVNHHDVGKPPRAPPVVTSRRREDVILESEDSADVYRPVHITSPNIKPSVTRSSTMPKSNKLMAGWFRKKKQR